MEEFKSNTDREKEQPQLVRETKPLVQGKLKKKDKFAKLADNFISDDAQNIKSYILIDILIPTIKKAISEIVTNGIDMLLYGETGKSKKSGTSSKISYRSYYDMDENRDRIKANVYYKNGYEFDDIIFDTRGEAERALDAMHDVLNQYDMVSVSDYYDIANVPNTNYTMNRYGWTSLARASVSRVREGYIIKLPRVIPLS